MKRLVCLTFIIYLSASYGTANPPPVTLTVSTNPGDLEIIHLTEEEGLSSRITYFLLKDHYGFIWIATNNGLDRYDGTDIKTFRNNGRDSLSLPKAEINSLYEDHSGILWICTGNGLSRHNRADESFMTWTPVNTDAYNPANVIFAAHEDRAGRFWLFTGAGLYAFDTRTNSFTGYTAFDISAGFPEEYRMANIDYNVYKRFLEDREGNIWIGTTRNGLFRITPDGQSVDHFDSSDPACGLGDNVIQDISLDAAGMVWVTTASGGLYRITDRNSGVLTKFSGMGNSELLKGNLVTVYPGQQNTLWVFTQDGIVKVNGTDLTLTDYFYPAGLRQLNIYGKIIEDPGSLWFTTSRGLCRFNKFSDDLSCYAVAEEEKGMLRNMCYSMERDDEGALWINHLYPGIDRAMVIRKPVKSLIPYERTVQGIASYYIPFIDSRDRLWIGHRGAGLVRYSIGPGQLLQQEAGYLHNALRRATLSSNSIIDLFEDRQGTIWIGTENGLDEYVEEDGTFRRHLHSLVAPVTVAPVYEDRKGIMWIGLGDRLAIFDRATGTAKTVDIYARDHTNYSRLWINQLYEDVSGNFWIATARKGLLKLNRDTRICEVYRADPADPRSISCNNITALYEDRQGRLWAASEYGLNLMDRGTGHVRVFGEKDGMADEYIFYIGEDDKGNLWLCTRKGITRFNPDDGSVVNLDHGDGMVNNGFIFRTAFSGRSGIMFFGGPEGVDYFNPEKISRNPFVPPVYITGITINEGPVHFDKPVMDLEKVGLPYNSNNISIDFIAVSFTRSEKNQYAYMLEGFDKDWIISGTESEARYTNIDPGRYTFVCKGSNNDGVWNEKGCRLSIIIRPPWWRSASAYIAYLLLSISMLYFYIRLRTWRLSNEKEELERQVSERTRKLENQKAELMAAKGELEQQKEELQAINEELQDTLQKLQKAQAQLIISEKMAGLGELIAGVAHEVSTPVGISITAASSLADQTEKMAELYRKDKISRKDFKEYLEYASEAAKLVLSNMERTDALLQSFKQVSVDQSTEQKREFELRTYFNDLLRSLNTKFRDRRITINLNCDERLIINSYPGAYAQILTNLVTNSITHGFRGGPGVINVSVESPGKELVLVYSDDGIGIAPDVLPRIFDPFFTTDHAAGTGLGLHIVYNLVTQKLGGTITCASEEGEGVVFTITIPVG